MPGDMQAEWTAMVRWILDVPADRILSITRVSIEAPEPARIMKSEPCSMCGDATMASRLREVGGTRMCEPCSESFG
jgi:formylmethanofuran dehydrogenase subunit E